MRVGLSSIVWGRKVEEMKEHLLAQTSIVWGRKVEELKERLLAQSSLVVWERRELP